MENSSQESRYFIPVYCTTMDSKNLGYDLNGEEIKDDSKVYKGCVINLFNKGE